MNAFGGMFAAAAAAGYHQDPYHRMAVLHHHQDPAAAAAAAAAMHHHHAHHHHHAYKVPRIYFKIPKVLPFKEQKEKFDSDDLFKKLARESEVRLITSIF
jgi:CRISPR/Cas system-associated endonuclease Cas3-HD